MIKIFQNHIITPKPSFQVLLNNQLEKEVQRIVYSFNFPLHLFLSSKFYVQNNHIYSRGILYLLSSFLYLLITGVVLFYHGFLIEHKDHNMKQTANTFFSILVSLFNIIQFICLTLLFCLHIVHRHNNINLVLKIQTIFNSINFKNSIRSYVMWNYISILSYICLDFYCFSVYVIFHSNAPFIGIVTELLGTVAYLSFDVNYILAIRLIILLKICLDEWIKEILAIHDTENNNEHRQKMLDIYQNIFEAYNLYNTIFRVLVS